MSGAEKFEALYWTTTIRKEDGPTELKVATERGIEMVLDKAHKEYPKIPFAKEDLVVTVEGDIATCSTRVTVQLLHRAIRDRALGSYPLYTTRYLERGDINILHTMLEQLNPNWREVYDKVERQQESDERLKYSALPFKAEYPRATPFRLEGGSIA